MLSERDVEISVKCKVAREADDTVAALLISVRGM